MWTAVVAVATLLLRPVDDGPSAEPLSELTPQFEGTVEELEVGWATYTVGVRPGTLLFKVNDSHGNMLKAGKLFDPEIEPDSKFTVCWDAKVAPHQTYIKVEQADGRTGEARHSPWKVEAPLRSIEFDRGATDLRPEHDEFLEEFVGVAAHYRRDIDRLNAKLGASLALKAFIVAFTTRADASVAEARARALATRLSRLGAPVPIEFGVSDRSDEKLPDADARLRLSVDMPPRETGVNTWSPIDAPVAELPSPLPELSARRVEELETVEAERRDRARQRFKDCPGDPGLIVDGRRLEMLALGAKRGAKQGPPPVASKGCQVSGPTGVLLWLFGFVCALARARRPRTG